jgi:predicted Zn-dependent protease
VLLAESHPRQALEQLRVAQKLDPSAAEAFDLMAQAETELGNPVAASQAAERARLLRAHPSTRKAHAAKK